MTSAVLPPDIDVSSQIDELLRQVMILRQREKEQSVVFCEERRQIRWNGGALKMGKKEYLFVRTVWFGGNHVADFLEIEEAVWGSIINKTGKSIDRHTVCVLAASAGKKLKNDGFPYKMETVKSGDSAEIQGWSLVPADTISAE